MQFRAKVYFDNAIFSFGCSASFCRIYEEFCSFGEWNICRYTHMLLKHLFLSFSPNKSV